MSSAAANLLELEAELETQLTGAGPELRDTCAIVRGRLELARDHGEPFSVDDVERDLARVAHEVGRDAWRVSFLRSLRKAAQWIRLGATAS